MPPISGKTCIVTGGTRGIGRALVEQLLSRGNTVVATGRAAAAAAEQLRPLSEAHPERLLVTELDVASGTSVTGWAAALKERHGLKHVDLCINNAGIYSPDGRRPKLEDFTQEDFLPVFAANTVGPFLVVQQLLAQGLLGAPGGRSTVVNITSIMGSNTDPTVSAVTPGAFAYRSSKAALNSVSTTLARDFERDGRGIDVALVHPGYVQTDMTGGQGWVTVGDSSAGIMRLLEDGRPLNGRWYSYNGDAIEF